MDNIVSDTDEDIALSGKELVFTPAEIEGIRLAIEDADQNGTIPSDEVEAWLDSLDTDHPLPEPQPRKS